MKRILLWLILILLVCFAGWIIYLKINDSINDVSNNFDPNDVFIETDNPILSSWVSVEREKYINDEFISNERYIVSLMVYETSMEVCVGSAFNCEELKYNDLGEKIVIDNGTLGFTGEFIKVNSDDDSIMKLMQVDNDEQYIYYFEKPAG